MSSILDALNKLEGEKERERAIQDLDPADINPAEAAEDLIEPDALRDSMTLRVRPMTLIAGAIGFLVLIVVIVAITVSVMVDSEPREQVAAIPPVAEAVPPTPVEQATIPASSPVAVESTPPPAEPVPVTEAPVVEDEQPVKAPAPVEKTPETVKVSSPEPAPESVPVAVKQEVPAQTPEPEPVEAVTEEPAIVEPVQPEAIEPEPLVVAKAEAPIASTPEPITPPVVEPIQPDLSKYLTLPRFTVALQRKHGFDKFKINMINPESDTNPYGNAIINREKVFEEAYIGGNQVKLIKVTREGIAVEVVRSGDKYFHDF